MSICDLIGDTPTVRFTRIPTRPDVEIHAKLEGHNPGGSVKDRAAYGMISGALERGELKAGDRLVEATSGNTGIALAMVGGLMGLRVTLVVPAGATMERVATMEAYGAEVMRTSQGEDIEVARETARAIAANGTHHTLDQFANPDNPAMHARTTGPEIWKATAGRITHFVSAMGTTGTVMGVSRALKERNPDVRIVGIQPREGSRIPGIRRWSPAMTPAIYEPERVDRIVEVSESEARDMTRRLAREEGILAGMSSGGALAAAVRVASEIDSGVVVFVVCDRGDRYLSSDLFG